MRKDKSFADSLKKTVILSEENLAFEMAEDERLRSLGVDPDGDPVEIMTTLDAMGEDRRARLEGEAALRQKPKVS